MRKIIYILLVAAATSLTFSACTEEEVTPTLNQLAVEELPILCSSILY